MSRWPLFLILALPLLCSCATSSKLIHDSEYDPSAQALASGDVESALKSFPVKENGGYVTEVEKAWVGLWSSGRSTDELERLVRSIDGRVQISVSREAKSFLYCQTEQGYIPSEHEIVALFLIAAMKDIKNQQWEKAKVEARRAAFYLQSFVPESKPHFDDPALRLWLATIWMALGDWDTAKVDLLNIEKMTGSPQAAKWARMPSPPADVTLQFDGIGPELIWHHPTAKPEFKINALRPAKKVDYLNSVQDSYSSLLESAKSMVVLGSAPWYQRHLERNDAIREIIGTSNYMTEFAGVEASSLATKSAGYGIGGSIEIVGAGLAAVRFEPDTKDGIGGRITKAILQAMANATGVIVRESGRAVRKTLSKSADSQRELGLRDLEMYRFVRFLPNWFTLLPVAHSPSPKSNVVYSSYKASKTRVSFVNNFANDELRTSNRNLPSNGPLQPGSYCVSGTCKCSDGSTVSNGNPCP